MNTLYATVRSLLQTRSEIDVAERFVKLLLCSGKPFILVFTFEFSTGILNADSFFVYENKSRRIVISSSISVSNANQPFIGFRFIIAGIQVPGYERIQRIWGFKRTPECLGVKLFVSTFKVNTQVVLLLLITNRHGGKDGLIFNRCRHLNAVGLAVFVSPVFLNQVFDGDDNIFAVVAF